MLLFPNLVATLPSSEAASKSSSIAHLELSIGGMSCEGCARQIESAPRRHDGVRSAKVDFKVVRLAVEYAPDKTSPQKIILRGTQPGPAPRWGDVDPGVPALLPYGF